MISEDLENKKETSRNVISILNLFPFVFIINKKYVEEDFHLNEDTQLASVELPNFY